MIKHLLYVLFVFSAISGFAQSKHCAKNLSAEKFQLTIDSCTNEIIIDVRPTDIFKNKIITNAIFVPNKNILFNLTDTIDIDTPILVYCAIGVRSSNVCELLCEKGFLHVINLNKGIEDWKNKGYKVITVEK